MKNKSRLLLRLLEFKVSILGKAVTQNRGWCTYATVEIKPNVILICSADVKADVDLKQPTSVELLIHFNLIINFAKTDLYPKKVGNDINTGFGFS